MGEVKPVSKDAHDERIVWHVETVRRLASFMDAYWTIPGTNIKIGLDPLLGLIPGFGDWAGALFSIYLVYAAAALGAPKSTLTRMIFNIFLDFAIGLIPFAGDIADFFWRANAKNVELLEKAALNPASSQRPGMALAVSLGIAVLTMMGITVLCLGVATWFVAKTLGLLAR